MTDDREQRDLDQQWEGLARFLAGESAAEEERAIRAELAADADRAALVSALEGALLRHDEPPLSPREVESALASVMARRDRPADDSPAASSDVAPLAARRGAGRARPQPQWRTVALRAAAVMVVVAGLSIVWRGSRTRQPTAPAGGGVAAAVVHATRIGQVDTLRLADGSTVVLGPESRLALDDGFGGQSREVRLEGQAFFDVVHDDARAFIVRTTNATLRDVGTTFSVRSDSADGTRVSVTSGAVDVTATQRAAYAPTLLHAGDRAEVSGERVRVERGVVSDAELSWTRGVLELHDAPLPVVAQELRRWYGVKLVVTDSTIASRRLTATFEQATADDVGRVLAAVLGGSVTRSGDTLRLGAAGGR
jgi:transmembrane sensor